MANDTLTLSGEVATILKFGFIGLAFLFAYLTYRVIVKLVDQPRVSSVKVTLVSLFMVLCLALGYGGFHLDLTKNTQGSANPLSKFLTDRIANSYLESGQAADILEGKWDAVYFQQVAKEGVELQLDDIQSMLDTVSFKVDSLFQKLPTESINIRCHNSGFVLESIGKNTSTNEKFVIWGVGRISPTKDITFTYWSSKQDQFDNRIGEEIYSGINFLKLVESTAVGEVKYPTAKGIWMGRNTYGNVVFGLTFWKRRV